MEILKILVFILLPHIIQCNKKLTVKKFGMCDDGINYPCKLYTSFMTKDDVQYLTANVSLSEDLGDNVMVHVQVFRISLESNKSTKIIDVKEKFCKLAKTYIGPFMDDVEKVAQILPGSCPIPGGKYHINDFALNLNKLFLRGIIPYGTLKFVGRNTDIKTGQLLICYEVDVQVS